MVVAQNKQLAELAKGISKQKNCLELHTPTEGPQEQQNYKKSQIYECTIKKSVLYKRRKYYITAFLHYLVLTSIRISS